MRDLCTVWVIQNVVCKIPWQSLRFALDSFAFKSELKRGISGPLDCISKWYILLTTFLVPFLAPEIGPLKRNHLRSRFHGVKSYQPLQWLRTCSSVLRVSCDAQCYRRQRFKPFGLISMRLVGYTIPQVAEVQTLWLVRRRFLVCEILQVAEVHTLWSG